MTLFHHFMCMSLDSIPTLQAVMRLNNLADDLNLPPCDASSSSLYLASSSCHPFSDLSIFRIIDDEYSSWIFVEC